MSDAELRVAAKAIDGLIARNEKLEAEVGRLKDRAEFLTERLRLIAQLTSRPSIVEMVRNAVGLTCEACQGNGYRTDHSPGCSPDDGYCRDCPVQVQCEACTGNGYTKEEE